MQAIRSGILRWWARHEEGAFAHPAVSSLEGWRGIMAQTPQAKAPRTVHLKGVDYARILLFRAYV
jgi:hypothetical protein